MAGFDKAALERLMTLGRRRGHLTTADLEGELPVNAMQPDEIALVIVHLEEAGIPVEVDAGLLTGEPRPAAPPDTTLILPERETLMPPAAPIGAGSAGPGPAAPPVPAAEARPGGLGSHRAVAIGGAVALVILVVLILAAGGA
jgi:hypothetical protein